MEHGDQQEQNDYLKKNSFLMRGWSCRGPTNGGTTEYMVINKSKIIIFKTDSLSKKKLKLRAFF